MTIRVEHLNQGADLAAAFEIRREVFNVGQGIPQEEDLDGKDDTAQQFLVFDDEAAIDPIGTARYRVLEDGIGKVERVAVLPVHEGKNAATAIMIKITRTALAEGLTGLVLNAQNTGPVVGLYEKVGYQVVGPPEDEVGIEHVAMALDLSPKKSPFPRLEGKQRLIVPGEYGVLEGSNTDLDYVKDGLELSNERREPPFAGARVKGLYVAPDDTTHRLISFLYNKRGKDGKPETAERLVAITGKGYGVHPDHIGQAPTWYVVGAQLGTVDRKTGAVISHIGESSKIPIKHFSLSCIVGGPYGEPVLANPMQPSAK
jgi:predicted GNAT family N-acyltransferase